MEVCLLAAKTNVQHDDIARVLSMVNGYQQTCLVAAAVQLGLFERLADGAQTVGALADELAVDRNALARLVRALTAIGLVSTKGDCAALAAGGRLLLKSGFASGIRAWTLLIGGEYLRSWGNLAESVRTGGSVFETVFACSPWQHRKNNPALNEAFNHVTSAEQVRTISALIRGYDFSGRKCVADIGGGHGNLLGGVLAKYPTLQGIAFDLPHVVDGARPALLKAGVMDRCRIVGGSFLDAIPVGADVHVLKHVLHNWDDQHCIRILTNLRSAIADGGSLLILEDVIPADNLASGLSVVMLDIHMLVVHGGRERTLAEYEKLLAAAGFGLARHIATRAGVPDILEAIPTELHRAH